MELDEPTTEFAIAEDRRPRVPEPLPVRLVAIADARLIAPAGIEPQLDAFYVGLWGFVREAESHFPVYRADNFNLRFDVLEPPIVRDDLRPLAIQVLSLAEAQHKLIDYGIAYVRQKGINPGEESLMLLDPAGNWIEISGTRGVM